MSTPDPATGASPAGPSLRAAPPAVAERWPEFLLLGLLALLWGSSYLFLKIAVTEIPPFTVIAIRCAIATAMILAVIAWRRERLPRDARTWRMLAVQSVFNATAAWTLLAWGQQHIDSGVAAVLNSTSPIFVYFFTLLITRHEAVTGLKLAGAIIGLTGVAMIVGVDALKGLGSQVAGQLAALVGAMLYAAAAIYGKRFSHISSTVTAAGTMACASVVLVPLSLIHDAPWTLTPSWRAIGAATLLGVFCTGFALLIYFQLVRTLGSMGVASQAYLRAGFGVMLGVVLLGETLTPVVGIGVVLAVLGVIAINIRR